MRQREQSPSSWKIDSRDTPSMTTFSLLGQGPQLEIKEPQRAVNAPGTTFFSPPSGHHKPQLPIDQSKSEVVIRDNYFLSHLSHYASHPFCLTQVQDARSFIPHLASYTYVFNMYTNLTPFLTPSQPQMLALCKSVYYLQNPPNTHPSLHSPIIWSYMIWPTSTKERGLLPLLSHTPSPHLAYSTLVNSFLMFLELLQLLPAPQPLYLLPLLRIHFP